MEQYHARNNLVPCHFVRAISYHQLSKKSYVLFFVGSSKPSVSEKFAFSSDVILSAGRGGGGAVRCGGGCFLSGAGSGSGEKCDGGVAKELSVPEVEE